MQDQEPLPKDLKWYQWFIAVTADGNYRFVPAHNLRKAQQYVGTHGGGIYTHAGYLTFASDTKWYNWLTRGYAEKAAEAEKNNQIPPPNINVPELDCIFAPDVLQWLQENEEDLKEVGGKYYDYIPRH